MNNVTPFPRKDTSVYTVEQLAAMGDDEFNRLVTDNLKATMRWKSPFQQDAVVRRTLLSLVAKLHATDATLRIQAEDPTVSVERYESAQSFRRHLLAAVDVTERRASFLIPRAAREASEWKTLLHEVLDELVDTEFDDVLDEFDIPFADGMSLRMWRDARIVKDPSRAVPVKELAA
ncbi:hypothetical protein MRBLMI12_000490 [Microbacterium sp. LMI12-1-1.1]|uniref:hypothetical protein n=1 Tax=Microbacterium sp. LMI12-1-1.1 TaxID=3135225 RepID=UPI00342304BC